MGEVVDDVTAEFVKIRAAYEKITDLFAEMQLSPAEGVAVLDLVRQNTITGMGVAIFGESQKHMPKVS